MMRAIDMADVASDVITISKEALDRSAFYLAMGEVAQAQEALDEAKKLREAAELIFSQAQGRRDIPHG